MALMIFRRIVHAVCVATPSCLLSSAEEGDFLVDDSIVTFVIAGVTWVSAYAGSQSPIPSNGACHSRVIHPEKMVKGLTNAFLKQYHGNGDGGLAHTTYWTIDEKSQAFLDLEPEEQEKAKKVKGNLLHSELYTPTGEVSGWEVTGTLPAGEGIEQRVLLKIPDNWNGRLVVGGTPGLRNEFSNEGILAPWLVGAGYAFVNGDKGLLNGGSDMILGEHRMQYWWQMMISMAQWAHKRIKKTTGFRPLWTYAIDWSAGGYQVRRALELDHLRVCRGKMRLFNGGVDWSGMYWPDASVLDTNHDGNVTPSEFAAGPNLVDTTDQVVLALGWPHAEDTYITPEYFAMNPPFAPVHPAMNAAGFSSESAVFWGQYNTRYDALKSNNPMFRGLGYYNYVTYAFRADTRGDTTEQAAAYSPYYDESYPDEAPPMYSWLANATDGGWTSDHVAWALKNANTGLFSVPLISFHGTGDALLGIDTHAKAYRNAVERNGIPWLHRLYIIEYGVHIDLFADGHVDYDFDGENGEEGIADAVTPLQAYAQRSFRYLVRWVEWLLAPPANKVVQTDPAHDPLSADELNW